MNFAVLARAATSPQLRQFLQAQAALAEAEAAVPPSAASPIADPAAPAVPAFGELAGAIGELGTRLDAVEQRKAASAGLTDAGRERVDALMAERHLSPREAVAALDREHPEPALIATGTYALSPVASSRAEPVAEDAVALLLRGDDDEFLRRMVGTAGSNSIW